MIASIKQEAESMKTYLLCALIAMLALAGCAQTTETPPVINSFEDCVAAGNPVMESYPMQCRADGQTFTEEAQQPIERLGPDEAMAIALDSECTEKGTLKNTSTHNRNTDTWWIDLEMKPEFANEMCNPACVVSEETKKAEINWRCTGLVPE